MQTWERRAFAETAFKRLYWQGWNGRFALFSWPTEYVRDGILWQAVDPQNYDRSEFQARRSGAVTLSIVLNGLRNNFQADKICLMAHSMGNVVLSEALRLRRTQAATTYFAMQSAEVSGAYTRKAAPPLVPNNTVSSAAYDSNYTPDLLGFSSPRSVRSLVNWAEWDQGYRTGGEDDPERTGSTAWESYRLSRPADGEPYHISIIDRGIVPLRFAYFNGSDPATSAAWNYTQLARPDFGFKYTPLLVGQRPPNAQLGDLASYRDYFVIDTTSRIGRRYAQTPPFLLLPTENGPRSRDRLLQWSPDAMDPNGLTARAAILAFTCKSWTQAVGTINTEDPNLPGGPLGIFNQTIDARDEFKIAGGELDHSAFFVYSIQRMWKGWASIKARAGGN